MANLKIRLWRHQPIQGRLVRANSNISSELPDFTGDMVNDQFRLFYFRKRRNIIDLPWGFCVLPWDQEIEVKTASFMAKLRDLAGLSNFFLKFSKPWWLCSWNYWNHMNFIILLSLWYMLQNFLEKYTLFGWIILLPKVRFCFLKKSYEWYLCI